MITLDELKNIRERAYKEINIRNKEDKIKVVVGMATAGIALGASDVIKTFVSEINEKDLFNVEITMDGNIDDNGLGLVVEIYAADKKTTYVKVDSDKAKRIVQEHIVNGNVINEFLMENN